MNPCLLVLDPGVACAFQDAGRWGLQRFGMPVSGALDRVSLSVANILAGNPPETVAIEVLGAGLSLKVEADAVTLAVAGAASSVVLEGAGGRLRFPPYRTVTGQRGDVFVFGPPSSGSAYYIAAAGGFIVPKMMGSAATYRRASLGGLEGRFLRRDDRLPLATGKSTGTDTFLSGVAITPPAVLRVLSGPNRDYFTRLAFDTFFSSSYTVSPRSDRMGLRLQGPTLERAKQNEVAPQATTEGAIQVPPDGQPILLLADRQTTGGYPRIATVISADAHRAAQLTPGMTIRFAKIGRNEAVALLAEQRAWLKELPLQRQSVRADIFSSDRLLSHNLIDGVTDGNPVWDR